MPLWRLEANGEEEREVETNKSRCYENDGNESKTCPKIWANGRFRPKLRWPGVLEPGGGGNCSTSLGKEGGVVRHLSEAQLTRPITLLPPSGALQPVRVMRFVTEDIHMKRPVGCDCMPYVRGSVWRHPCF
eukprot:2934736-Pyramimonas_sp.AAC.1